LGTQLEVFSSLPYHDGLISKGYPVLSAASGRYAKGLRKFGLALVLGAGLLTGAAQARGIPGAVDAVPLAELPQEAQRTERLIRRGGPFPYAKDGTVFGNRERILPREKRGYYREYTVQTPGSRNRGARRIVCGGKAPTAPDACYYTADHYSSFKRIEP
jgi:ribonuclease T1